MEVAQYVLSSEQKEESQFTVVGTVRRQPSSSSTDEMIRCVMIDDWSALEEEFATATHILWTIPLAKEDPQLDKLFEAFLKCTTASHKPWTGFLSTTGVYGNHDGARVTEESPLLCKPESNANLYQVAEHRLLEKDESTCQIFRCAGIYDATRSALHTVYKQGQPPKSTTNNGSDKTSDGLTNRVHAEDIARVVLCSMRRHSDEAAGRIFNVADDEPAARNQVLNYAADLLEEVGIALPGRESPIASSSSTRRTRRRLTERKLVANQRIKEELLLSAEKGKETQPVGQLQYPSYREGLSAILGDPRTPWYPEISNAKEDDNKESDL